jgi:hypothetical protein
MFKTRDDRQTSNQSQLAICAVRPCCKTSGETCSTLFVHSRKLRPSSSVVLTLGLAIGANTTVFTVINTLLLNPLPVPKSSGLVSVNSAKLRTGVNASVPLPICYPDFKDIQSRSTAFHSLAAYSSPHGVTWRADNSAQGLFVELVSGNYFSTLDLSPSRGRFFLPEEDTNPGAHPVAIMNYGTWKLRFGGNSDITGKTLRLNDVVLTIVGVAPSISSESMRCLAPISGFRLQWVNNCFQPRWRRS